MLSPLLIRASTLALGLSWTALAAAQAAAAPPDAAAGPPADVAPAAVVPMSSTPATPMPTSLPQATEARADVVEHSWPNRPLLITGAVVLGGSYAASAIVAAASSRKADDKLFYPVVGPWLDLKARDCEINDCGNDTFNKALLIGDGALQGIGAVVIILGLVIPESEAKPWYLIGDQNIVVAPQVGTNATGLVAVGQF